MHFEREFEDKGSDAVVAEYVFANNDRADGLLARGSAHAGIHLGFRLDLKRPAIVAEALVQACVHEGWTLDFCLAAEMASTLHKQVARRGAPLLELYDKTRTVIEEMGLIATNYKYHENCVKYGIENVAAERLLPVLSQWVIDDDSLAQRNS